MTKAQKKALRQKKNKLIKELNTARSEGDFSDEKALEFATSYIKIADLDGNGTIDLKEFTDFILKCDEEFP